MNANNQTDEYKQTIKDVCEQRQLSTQSIGVKFRRTFGTGYSVDLVPTDEQFAVLFGNIKTRKQQPSPKTGCRTRRARRTDHSGGKELVRTKGWETGGGGGVGSKAGGLGPKAGGLGSKAGGLGSVAGQRTIAGHLCSAVNSGPSAARMGI